MYNDTHLNVLISYAYLYGQDAFLSYTKEQTNNGVINLMIDSVAFTKFNSKSKMSHDNVADYCNFLQEWQNYCEKYVMLDVVGNEDKSRANYEIMLNRGLNPMFVMTMFDKDYNYMRNAVANQPHVCVAGGVTTKSDWMTKRFQDIYRESNNEAKIHGLGYVTFPKMMQLPLHSVDSSSWSASIRFGALPYFSNGMKSIDYRKVLARKEKLTLQEQSLLSSIKVTPKMFCNKLYHRGQSSIGCLLAIKAH